MTEMNRIEVGFVGHQVITLKIGDPELTELREKLTGGGWHTVSTDDDEVDIDLGKVAFVRVASGAGAVGFGSAG